MNSNRYIKLYAVLRYILTNLINISAIEKNLKLWKQMLLGSEIGKKCCVRAKIDIQAKNVYLQDPIIYRCKHEPYSKTANKYK